MTYASWARILPRSMLTCSVQSRNFIAILLMAAIPFCCCDFRTLLGGNLSCKATSLLDGGVTSAHLGPAKSHGPSTQGCCHGKSATETGTSDPDPKNDPSDQPRDCSCDKSGGKMLSVEKPALEHPAQVVVAVLEWAQWPELPPLNPVSGREPLRRAVHRPLTSLVRMHCALIV